MGTIRYTVTTITKRCPHCGKIIDEESHGQFTPLYGIAFLFTFPIVIPYLLIRFLVLKDPQFPKVGPKTFSCPDCSMPIKTNNVAITELNEKGLFLHKFKKWVYLCYALGGVFGISIFFVLINEFEIFSIYGLFALMSLIGIIYIVIAYRTKYEHIKQSEPKCYSKENSAQTKEKSDSCLYCRKCGAKLPSDSIFCHKCATEVKK